jgi:tetratricopeptide (TPR) repeat protein
VSKQPFGKRCLAVEAEAAVSGLKGLRKSREEQLEEELALNHPEVLALSKIKQHKPARALEVLKAPLEALRAKKGNLTPDETLRLHHLLGLRLLALVGMNEIREAMFVADEQMALLPKNATGISNRGFVQAAAGDHFSAAESHKEAIELAKTTKSPKTPYLDAYYGLALALRNLSDLQGALDALAVVLEHDPAHYDTLNLKASIYLEMGRAEVARELYLEAVRMDGTRPEAYAELGNLFYGNGVYEHATSFLKEALKRDPQHVDALVYMGNVLVMTNYPQEAMTTYDSALLVDPNNVKALLSKAALLGRLNQFNEAIRVVDQVISRNSNIPQAYVTKGEAFEQLGKQEEALQSFERAIDTDVRYRKAYLAQFNLLHKMGRLDQLEDAAHKASQSVHEFADAFMYMGFAQSTARRWKEAKVSYEKALAITPTSSTSTLAYVSCLTNLGEIDEAFAVLEKSAHLDRKSLSYNYSMALLLNAAKRFEEAIEALNRALAVEPTFICLQMRASLLHRLGRYDEAHDDYDQLIKISPNPARFHISKGHVYVSQRNYIHAIDCFDAAVEIDALMRPLALRSKIGPLRALERNEEAQACIKQLGELSVNNPANMQEAQPELQYRPIQQTREENSEEEDIQALKEAVNNLRSPKKP